MSKEKNMLKAILANTELIMAHLNIKNAAKTNNTPAKQPAVKTPVKAAAKKTAVKKK